MRPLPTASSSRSTGSADDQPRVGRGQRLNHSLQLREHVAWEVASSTDVEFEAYQLGALQAEERDLRAVLGLRDDQPRDALELEASSSRFEALQLGAPHLEIFVQRADLVRGDHR